MKKPEDIPCVRSFVADSECEFCSWTSGLEIVKLPVGHNLNSLKMVGGHSCCCECCGIQYSVKVTEFDTAFGLSLKQTKVPDKIKDVFEYENESSRKTYDN